jgi:hypothetical protein
MPRVSQFFGITIYLYYSDHAPPHFHAKYQGEDAAFDIQTLALLHGGISPRARALVTEWASQHQEELLGAWNQCRRNEHPNPIEPLR